MRKGTVAAILALLMMLLCATAWAEETMKSGDYEYRVLDDGTAEITDYSGKDETLEVPAVLDGRSVTRIGDGAFQHCSTLTSVILPEGVTAIGDPAFYDCTSLTSINLPDSLLNTGSNPFPHCNNLREIRVSTDHPALDVIDGVLFSKADKRLVCYPPALERTEYTVPMGVKIIGDGAFSWCTSLSSITLPDSLIHMGEAPFQNCDNLREIRVSPDHPALDVIDGVLFSKADKRLVCYPPALESTEYTVPKGVRIIGNCAFYGCESLTSITLPDSVTEIGVGAFSYCDSLTSLTLPDSVTEIGDYAFSCCTSLSSITLPSSVTTIGRGAFSSCNSLVSITLPDSVTEIGERAFSFCRSMTSITLPEGVTEIGDDAFSYCLSLTSVTLPSSIESIGKEAFAECPNLTLTVPRDSYAASYAKENGIPYEYPDSHDWLND